MSLILFKIYDPLCPKLKTLIIYIGFKINNLRDFDCNFYTKVTVDFSRRETIMRFFKVLNNQADLSLIELMVAVTIIRILVAIAIRNYQQFQRQDISK